MSPKLPPGREVAAPLEDEVEKALNQLRSRLPSEKEAAERFKQYRRHDPFPHIAPALLNSSDFCDYIVTTGMIFPFHATSKDIKLASYALRIKGKAVYWNEKGECEEINIEQGTKFTLKKNSIAFVTLEPYLRLPDYIALRFNLKIDNVYKGLLLGTGPIIDPGFEGYLSMPLHNLTTNDYVIEGDARLIWVEFTKLGKHQLWSDKKDIVLDEYRHPKVYLPFNGPVGPDQDVRKYIYDATNGRSVQSSIPEAIYEARESANTARDEAQQAQKQVETIQRRTYRSLFLTLTGIIIAITVGIYPIVGMVSDTNAYLRDGQSKLAYQDQEIKEIQQDNARLKHAQLELEQRLTAERKRLDAAEKSQLAKGTIKNKKHL